MDGDDHHLYYSGMLDRLTSQALVAGNCADAVLPPSWRWDNPGADGWRGLVLWVIVEGQGEMHEGGRTWSVARGDVFLMRYDCPRRGRHDPDRTLVLPWCVFDLADPALRPSLADWPGTLRLRPRDVDFVAELLRRGIRSAQDHESTERVDRWLRATLMELEQATEAAPAGESDAWARRLDRIAETMRRHPERRYRIPDLARACFSDPDHFARIFRRRFGLAPGRFSIRCRIDRARSLLRFTDLGVEAIANRLGYPDPYFFSRQFKQVTGTSPTDYRREA